MDKESLLKNKAFCILPWIHMHVWPNGNVMPCCVADSSQPFANIKGSTIEDTWNSDKYKELRKAMLEGEKLPYCKRCYELEDSTNIWTLRKNSNKYFLDDNLDLVNKTYVNGFTPKNRMAYLDIRFSNICNFKCRSCGPALSSQHAQEHADFYGKHELAKMLENDGSIIINVANTEGFWQDLEQYLLDVEEVYWAGGEALITDEHYKILDYWLEHNKTNIRMRYTTNFSNLKFKKKSIIDYWKQFKNVHVSASLDCNGRRAEYTRHGTHWSQIEENRLEMLEKVPNILFELTPTLSLYNLWNWPDFHMDWVNKGFVNIENCRFNILTNPDYMRIDNIPEKIKIEVRSKYLDYKSWAYDNIKDRLDKEPELQGDVIGKIDSTIRFLNKGNENNEKLKEFCVKNAKLDEYRKENFWSTFPELDWLKEYNG